MPKADAAQVRALVSAYAAGEGGRRALALRAEPEWPGPDVITVGAVSVRVMACRSPLAVREALVDHTGNGQLLVVLTNCSGAALGLDVRARLVKGDVLPLDPFSAVLALFGAVVLDPQLVGERWLIDDLIALAPAGGWAERRPPGGVLDVEVAWRTWHAARLGLDSEPDDLAGVIALGHNPTVGAVLAALDPDRRARVAARWARRGGGAAPVVVDLLAAGRGGGLAALGLVAGVLWASTDRSELARLQALARARLEDALGRDRLDAASADAWASVAAAMVASAEGPGEIVDAAEALLSKEDAVALAALSDVLPAGFDLRLEAVAGALAAGDVERAGALVAWAARHETAQRHSHRLASATAGVRLLRRRAGALKPPPATTFAAAAAAYAADGSYVEETIRLIEERPTGPEVTTGYAELAAGAAADRATEVARFTSLLAEWSRSEPLADDRIVPLEDVLDRIVAVVAAAAPVLLVVCDGMGLPVAHELLRDLVADGWSPALPEGREQWPVGVALLPTVTEASRTSLLTGARTVGGQAEERAGFAAHPALRAASAASRPPVLYHKASLVAPAGTDLADPVRQAVADPDQRVVGVVVNSVDDHLARGDQVRVDWRVVTLRPLVWLLGAAAEAGRVVVITADHGHVLQATDSIVRQRPGGGERWRTKPPAPEDGEIEIAGPRVLLGGGRVVLPADRRLHYAGHKYGYHGGATPEEVLVPVEVLARRLPAGWHYRVLREPTWWAGSSDGPAPAPAVPAAAPALSTGRPGGQSSLFEEAEAPPTPTPSAAGSWVAALLSSPIFVANPARTRLARPITDDRVRDYLEAITANGDELPLAALASRTGEPADVLRLALSQVQRLLNVDGAQILVVRADLTVALNRALASIQFDLDAP